MQLSINDIKQKSLPILKEFGVIRSSIFGSYARGEEHTKSDVDILVELPEHYGLLDFVTLQLRLEKILKKKVDLVEYDAVKPRIKKQIFANQISIL